MINTFPLRSYRNRVKRELVEGMSTKIYAMEIFVLYESWSKFVFSENIVNLITVLYIISSIYFIVIELDR